MTQLSNVPDVRWLITGGLVVLAAVVLSYWFAKGRAGRGLRVTLAGLRWLIIAAIAVCLFNPEWVEAIKHQPKIRAAVLLDTSRSMTTKDVPQGRLAAAKTWLRTQFDASAPGEPQLDYFSFNQSLAPLPSVDSADATGDGTGLADALDSLLAVPRDEPYVGVVVCSDGIETTRRDPEAVARLYRRKGIPIHTLTVGSTNDVKDIVVENVRVKRAIPNRSTTKVGVVIRSAGFPGLWVPIQILSDGQMVGYQQAKLKEGLQTFELDFTPRQRGFQTFEVRIPLQSGEWLSTNNRRMFGLDVVDSTLNVIYMEGTPQQPGSTMPEWKYLKDALQTDPNIKVRTLYRQFGANGRFLDTVDADPQTGEQIYPVEHPTKGFPRTLNELLGYDVIIHSDIRTDSFSAEQLQNMARLVEEYGGGFVMIGGNSAFGKGGYHRTILDRIIPAAMERDNDSQARAVRLQVPPGAYNHPLIALGRNREETEMIWTERFPMLYGCNLVDRAKPGAVVLGQDAFAKNQYGPRLLLAVQNVGKGRSMAFTSDTTRTWGRDFETLWGEPINPSRALSEENCDSRYYRQFWVNAVRWLASGRMSRTNSPVTLELAESNCEPGEKVAAAVKVRDPQTKLVEGADVDLYLSTGGKTNSPIKAVFDRVSQAYLAEILPPTNGTFIVTAVAKSKSKALGDDRQLLVCEATDKELADLRARPDLMANLSLISGGRAVRLDDKAAPPIASLFASPPPATVEYKRNPLWDRWWWLGLVLGLLTIEWGARRLSGLA